MGDTKTEWVIVIQQNDAIHHTVIAKSWDDVKEWLNDTEFVDHGGPSVEVSAILTEVLDD